MKSARLLLLLVACSLVVVDSAHAESKWSWKSMWPSFGKKDDEPRDLYPAPKEPSMWTKMNQGTKNFFAKSKQMVPPWFMPETQDRVRRSNDSYVESKGRIQGEVREARRNIFAPWLDRDEPEKRPETVPDFLGQERPQ